jgi:hypothetical protein
VRPVLSFGKNHFRQKLGVPRSNPVGIAHPMPIEFAGNAAIALERKPQQLFEYINR